MNAFFDFFLNASPFRYYTSRLQPKSPPSPFPQVSDGALYRTKIHCYFLDQSRVVKPLPMEKNYHIFYQMLAGLSAEERAQLGLTGYTPRDLAFLNMGDVRSDEAADAARDGNRTNGAPVGL